MQRRRSLRRCGRRHGQGLAARRARITRPDHVIPPQPSERASPRSRTPPSPTCPARPKGRKVPHGIPLSCSSSPSSSSPPRPPGPNKGKGSQRRSRLSAATGKDTDRGILPSKQGTPGAEQGIDTPCSHLSASSVKFAAVGRLLSHCDTVRGRTEISPRCLPDEYRERTGLSADALDRHAMRRASSARRDGELADHAACRSRRNRRARGVRQEDCATPKKVIEACRRRLKAYDQASR